MKRESASRTAAIFRRENLLRIYFRKGGVKAEVKEKIEGLIYGREE